jgi:hypothetical protein
MRSICSNRKNSKTRLGGGQAFQTDGKLTLSGDYGTGAAPAEDERMGHGGRSPFCCCWSNLAASVE